MDEQEVELIDYLRVLWWGKWIVLACFVLAVGIAAGITWTKPPSYSATGSYEVLETMSLYVPPQETPSLDAPAQYVAILTKSAVQVLPNPDAAGLQRSMSQRDPNLIDVTISSTASPKAVEDSFASSIAALEVGLVAQVEQALARERARAEMDFEQVAGQVAILRAQMAGETREVVLKAYAEEIATLEARLAEVSVRRDGLGALAPRELVSLREIHRAPVVEVARNAKTTLALAGFLGLFLGVLVAFLTHYVISAGRGDGPKRVGM